MNFGMYYFQVKLLLTFRRNILPLFSKLIGKHGKHVVIRANLMPTLSEMMQKDRQIVVILYS
jgi:hypothetical protein